jgi:hypothetical protein
MFLDLLFQNYKKAEKNSKQRLPSQERAPKNRRKNAENLSEGHQKKSCRP